MWLSYGAVRLNTATFEQGVLNFMALSYNFGKLFPLVEMSFDEQEQIV